jgi:hypothetical protein
MKPNCVSRLVVAALAAALAGCGQPDAGTAAGETMPTVVAGKWRMKISVDGRGDGMPMDKCDPETPIDDLLFIGLPGNGSNCADRTLTQNSETSWSLHSVCNFIATGGRKADTLVTIDTKVTGNLKTRYQLESRQKMSAPMNGVTQQVIVQTGERIGDC